MSKKCTEAVPERARAVLDYWFGPEIFDGVPDFLPKAKVPTWFRGGPEIDKEITEKFSHDLQLAAQGAYDSWRDIGPYSLLAGIILMDQFTRNVYRNLPKAFELDPKSMAWALHAADNGMLQQVPPIGQVFLLMPGQHTEDLALSQRTVELYQQQLAAAEEAGHKEVAGYLAAAMKSACTHRDIVAKWGRFPHRNAILGRKSTPEEEAGLADGSIKTF